MDCGYEFSKRIAEHSNSVFAASRITKEGRVPALANWGSIAPGVQLTTVPATSASLR